MYPSIRHSSHRQKCKIIGCSREVIGKRKNIYRIAALVLLFVLITGLIMINTHEKSVPVSGQSDYDTPRLILDAGHGGLDGGAVSENGTSESEINLDIVLRMRDLLLLFGQQPILTRDSESISYPADVKTIREKKVWDQKHRVSQINAVTNGILISVHQNKFPDARPFGSEVFYGTATGADSFASIAQNNLISQLCPENRRVAAPISEKIYLMQQIHCPAILVECGFLSNPAEAELLQSGAYRTKLALVLLASYCQFVT